MRKISIILIILVNSFLLQGQESIKDHSYFKGGQIHVVSSSHQDIAWMDTPEKCIEFRDVNMITPALKRMAENPEFKFNVENAMNLYEYLERHPDSFDEIRKFTELGQLEWGANYNQPYEGMYDGEALIRQTYLGKKRLRKMIPGGNYTCAWDEDVPARVMQRPQMFAKAGIKYLQFSRFEPGLYNWYSPDGSYISCWTPGQYECSGRPIRNAKGDDNRTAAFTEILNNWNDYYKQREFSPDYIYISSHDFSKPLDYDSYFSEWNKKVDNGESPLPYINYSTGAMAIEAAVRKGKPDSIMGERPNVWLYIHGPGHERALKASRYASRRLVAAEKFATFDAMLKKDFSDYPQEKLTKGWEDGIYADHGWGGRFGHITDKLFRTKFENAGEVADEVVEKSITCIANDINFKEDGIPVVVFNSLSWERNDPVTFSLNTEGMYDQDFKLIDGEGKSINYQFIPTDNTDSDSWLKFVFIAEGVPAHGYKTYYLMPGQSGEDEKLRMDYDGKELTNQFYKIKLEQGGISSIMDKYIQQELVSESDFLFGEVFALESVGHGAGEFTRVQQPTMKGFAKMSQYSPNWQLLENGAVRTVLETSHPWEHCTVKQRLIVYNSYKRIDFEVDILGFDGVHSREYRLAFPMKNDAGRGKVAYESPMAVIEVGKDELPMPGGFSKPEQIYDTPCPEIHPREVQDWFSYWDENKGVTISTDVAAFDWVNPANNNSKEIVLQPILFATRRSCNGSSDSNWYLQRGNHHFKFSLTSFGSIWWSPSSDFDWKEGRQFGDQANQPMDALVIMEKLQNGKLPDKYSFVKINSRNVIVSTIKKCEDDNNVVLRCYDIEGIDSDVKVDFFKPVKESWLTNIIEEEPVNTCKDNVYKVGKYAIETFKLKF
ncbi:glycoside hydrolase family 38 N-terminal domain-containing protein [Draconibacterium sediminis]|nr:glycosyl hydrolase-related protein [Draconibacterium sediminis]